jgi:signal transduction histidine kinase
MQPSRDSSDCTAHDPSIVMRLRGERASARRSVNVNMSARAVAARGLARAELLAACVMLVTLTTLAVVTFVALRGEREQVQSRQQAEQMDRLRRSLWRMDSQLSSIIAREAARSPEQYLPFYPADRTQALNLHEQFGWAQQDAKGTDARGDATGQGAQRALQFGAPPELQSMHAAPDGVDGAGTSVLVPSGLLTQPDDVTRLHFQISPTGEFSSPQVPRGQQRYFAELRFTTPYAIERAEAKLSDLQGLYARQGVLRSELAMRAQTMLRAGTRGAPPESAAPEKVAAMSGEERAKTAGSAGGAAAASTGSTGTSTHTATAPNTSAGAMPAIGGASEGNATGVQSAGAGTTGLSAPSAPIAPGTSSAAATTARAAGSAAGEASEPNPSAANPAGFANPAGAANPASSANPAGFATPSSSASTTSPAASPATSPKPDGSRSEQTPASKQAEADFAARQSLARAANVTPEGVARGAAPRSQRPYDASGSANLLLEATSDEGLPKVVSQPSVRQEGFLPEWVVRDGASEPELVFVRTVEGPWGSVRQGFWLDWPALRTQLLTSVQDTAPGATLRPVLFASWAGGALEFEGMSVDASRKDVGGEDGGRGRGGIVPSGFAASGQAGLQAIPDDVLGRMLATVPAELVLAPLATGSTPWSPLRTALVATWLLVLASMLTLAWLARAADKLAENRGRFVTAVTHELRTPLTSFCLYSQMLADNMVQDEEAKREYARTLHGQSLRLSRIVESVLDYARLGRARRTLEPTTVGALRERVEPPLASICRRSGLSLRVVPPPAGWEVAALRTDLDTIDRILTNLIDNACKYASDGPDARAELAWLVEGQTLVVRVRDFGPGIPAGDRDRVFQAFERGSAHAGGATPGLGLGLALSHALAQEIGASLRLVDLPASEAGAAFELRLTMYA